MSLRQSTISPLWSKSSLVGVSGPSNASMCALLYNTELAAYESRKACMHGTKLNSFDIEVGFKLAFW